MTFFVFNTSSYEALKMKNDERIQTTIRINPYVWEIAGMKASCSRSELVERLLMNYNAVEGSIEDYEQKIKECEEIISQEKVKINEYKKAIQGIEKEERENEKNLDVINECYKRIDRYMKTHKTMNFNFLRTLRNTHKVSLNVLNKYCLDKEYEFD